MEIVRLGIRSVICAALGLTSSSVYLPLSTVCCPGGCRSIFHLVVKYLFMPYLLLLTSLLFYFFFMAYVFILVGI